MARTQTRVASLLDVSPGTAKSVNQEITKVLFSCRAIALRIHFPEDVVGWNLAIEGFYQAREAFFTDSGIDLGFVHLT